MIPRDTGSQTERLTKRRKRIAEQAFAFDATSGQRPKLPGPWRRRSNRRETRTRVNPRDGRQDAGEPFVRDRDAGRASLRD